MEGNVSLRPGLLIAAKATSLISSLIESLTSGGTKGGSENIFKQNSVCLCSGNDVKIKREWSEKSRVLKSSSIPCLNFLFCESSCSRKGRNQNTFFCPELSMPPRTDHCCSVNLIFSICQLGSGISALPVRTEEKLDEKIVGQR